MARRVFPCGICENINRPSICAACINLRLQERYKLLRRFSRRRDILRSQVEACLSAKHEADQQHHWKLIHKDHILKLKEKLQEREYELKKRKEELYKRQQVLDAQSHKLAVASAQLAKKQVEQLGEHQPDIVRTLNLKLVNIHLELQQRRRSCFRQLCKIFPLKVMPSSSVGGHSGNTQHWTICGARLPLGDDPHSVSKEDLGSSLGYLFQLVYLTACYLCAPLLHEGRLQGSYSCIWQRSSYWDPVCSNSGGYPLFLLTNASSSDDHTSDKGTSIMGFSTFESIGERLRNDYDKSPRYGIGSVQQGIGLLKRSVVCVTSYGFSELLPSLPSNMTTFQAFAELMNLLSSKEVKLRNPQNPINRLGDSTLSAVSTMDIRREGKDPRDFKVVVGGNSKISSSFYFISRDLDQTECKAVESDCDDWDILELVPLPPPPSHAEDVEHWTRAMFVDANY